MPQGSQAITSSHVRSPVRVSCWQANAVAQGLERATFCLIAALSSLLGAVRLPLICQHGLFLKHVGICRPDEWSRALRVPCGREELRAPSIRPGSLGKEAPCSHPC